LKSGKKEIGIWPMSLS